MDMRPIPILMDDREPAAMATAIATLPDFQIAAARLPAGDYRIDGRFLVERKTLPDLAASIASGRLFTQALRLVETENAQAALVLEGTAADLHDTGMRREAIQDALVTVSLFVGLPVLRTRSPAETARLFLYIARQGRAVAQGALPRRGRRPKSKAALQRHLLQGLPGVGPARAAALLEHFGSVAQVLTADEAALSEVVGIGPGLAGKLVWAVREAPPPYGHGVASAR